MQNQGSSREDQHVHQDAGPRRGAGVRGDRAQGGRDARQARDPVGRRALLADPRLAQVRRRAAAARRRARARDRAGPRAVPRGGARGGPQGRHHQAHPAHHAHVHRDAVARARARVRGDRVAGERGRRAQGDRGAHRAAHRGRRRLRARAGARERAARGAVPLRHRVAAAAGARGRLLVRRLVLVGRLVRAARGPARHLVVDGARRGPRRVAVVRVAVGRRGRLGVGVGPGAAVARRVAGARVRRVRGARRGGGAGAVRTQPVLPGVRAAAGGERRAVSRVRAARVLRDPHHLVRKGAGPAAGGATRVGRSLEERIFFTRIVIKILGGSKKNCVIEILVPKVGASPARPVRRAALPEGGRVVHDIFSYYGRFLLGGAARAALVAGESRDTLNYDRISKKNAKI